MASRRPVAAGLLVARNLRLGRVTRARSAPQSLRFTRAMSSHPSESFLSGESSNYTEAMYEAWKADRKSVHVSWDAYFRNVEAGAGPGSAVTLPPSVSGGTTGVITSGHARSDGDPTELLRVNMMIRSFQTRGHYVATLDPLGINRHNLDNDEPHEQELWSRHLHYTHFGFSEADMSKKFTLGLDVMGMAGLMGEERPMTLREIVDQLQTAYCGNIGVEFTHIVEHEQLNFIRNMFELPRPPLDKDTKSILHDRLAFADGFERFLANKYSTSKRFGLEGAETLIPGMKSLIDKSVDLGVETVVIGMPHRGRLNVLANVMRKPMESIIHEFMGGGRPEELEGSGDVKYHLGASMRRPTLSGKSVHMSLVANPSHLEFVNPVVEGKTAAKNFYLGDDERKRAMSILLHGDAAFAGQGVVYETMELADIVEYKTGGTIHIVVNNQVGFTTDPRFSRSSPYCSDVAKAVNAPIFHVNGDDIEAVHFVCEAAAMYRQKFGKSVVVDIVCYRRHGHNEIDEPAYTQPLMYEKIRAHPPTLQIYEKQLVKAGTHTQEQLEEVKANVLATFNKAWDCAQDPNFKAPKSSEWLDSKWAGFNKSQSGTVRNTGVEENLLKEIGVTISAVPEGFNVHPRLKTVLKARGAMVSTGNGIDWGTAEALAFGSLLHEGNHVRLSGQDVERGTFSHRHAVIHDQKTEKRHFFLQQISPRVQITNSMLSETAVLGYELGFSLEAPDALVCWEAQFGDFANGAQVIIDQFICCGEQKWLRQSGLVMLLPHGMEGQGPEHSSARPERFLQLMSDDPLVFPEQLSEESSCLQIQNTNMQVVNVSTPANYFHVLRRQLHSDARKPLIVMSPKSLLRHKLCVSSLDEFSGSSRFKRVIPETEQLAVPDDKVRKLVLCTGKVYYDLLQRRTQEKIGDIALVRIEQIAPFPFDHVESVGKQYPNAEVVWCQEEPQNQGCWSYVDPRIETALRATSGRRASYVGRGPAAAPATGNINVHNAELEAFLKAAFK